jgi:bifunctional lysine-specific demethylase and histidyl-hydroxylase NO66
VSRQTGASRRTGIEPSLAWLLQPIPVDTFLNEIWARKHYHVKRHRPGYFDDLLAGSSAVEELLESFQTKASNVRLIREHDKRSADNYRLADGGLDLARVRSDFADGYTIVLEDVEQYVRAIAWLTQAIEVELNFATKVNAYITPPESQGFVTHYDGHDVLILQIQGSKVWHLYEGAEVPPHQLRREDKWVAHGLPSPTDLRLEVGDVLYVPRGLVHGAEATSEPSVHLTVGIHAPTALTFVAAALNSLSFSNDDLNARLPPRHLDDADARATLGLLLRDAARAIEDPRAVEGGLDALADILVHRGQCPPVGQASAAIAIDGQTVVRKYRPLYSRVMTANGIVTLQFAQLSITADSDHQAALLFVSSNTKPFRVCELPGLRAVQQTELARTLIVSGFLVRCAATDLDDQPR